MRYRPEIDGLRAIAVIPVILFHAGFEVFSGGFIGVDVFFVISGYLITSIILADMEDRKFSLIDFYERRARRILPALLFMSALCIPLALLMFLPSDMKAFSSSVVSTMTFSSNVLFWYESGYFDTAAELKPLLHTWSLAIEEQYYIIFPLFLMLTWNWGKRWVLAVLVVGFFASLFFAQWGSYHKPNATFYLLPFRGWEILIGGFCAFYLNRKKVNVLTALTNQLLSATGLLLIFYSIIVFDAQTRSPSLLTLIPCVGVTLIILFSNEKTITSRILSSRTLVGVGLISYSAYLWHQPLFAFAKYHSRSELLLWQMIVLCVAVIVIAYFSWRYIEKPFRRREYIRRNVFFLSTFMASIFLVLVGSIGYWSDGYEKSWLKRQSVDIREIYLLLASERERDQKLASKLVSHDNNDCRFNIQRLTPALGARTLACFEKYGQGVAILGDSHATDLFGLVAASNLDKNFIIGVTKGGCRPHTPASGCQYEGFRSFVENNPTLFSRVIYEQAGFYLLRTDRKLGSRDLFAGVPLNDPVESFYANDKFLSSVNTYLQKLSEHVPVLWFGSRVEPHISERDILELGCNYEYRLRENQYEAFLKLDFAISNSIIPSSGVSFLSQNQVFDYQFPRDFMTCDSVYWTGGDHLSQVGEQYFGKRYDLLKHPISTKVKSILN